MFEGQPIEEDAARVFQCVQDGGVAIFPVSVGYAIVGHADEAIQKTYAAKQRSFEKPCGNFGDWQLFNEMLVCSDEAREMVRSTLGMLARHELYVAEFYLGRDHPEAAVGRLRHLLDVYDGSGIEPEALLLLGRTFLHMREVSDARHTFEELIERFPESGYAEQAREFLSRFET